ncbi:MAG: hypothetical protein NVSMB40_21000 [Aquirhabdus sp.]
MTYTIERLGQIKKCNWHELSVAEVILQVMQQLEYRITSTMLTAKPKLEHTAKEIGFG